MRDIESTLPSISIVVPSFNQGRYLADALGSIFSQDYPRVEVVVMDGGSKDNSVEVIHSYAPRLKYWQSQPDGGQSAAINAGMTHCTGEIVGWLNSDDYYPVEALWHLADAWQRYPHRGLYIGNGLRLLESTGQYLPFIVYHSPFNREALRLSYDYLLQPATFFSREAWDAVGGLNNDLHFCMDWDMFLRIADRFPVAVVDECLGVSREYEDTKTSTGGVNRTFEIVRMIQRHTSTDVTPGTLAYLLEALVVTSKALQLKEVTKGLGHAQGALGMHLANAFPGDQVEPAELHERDAVYFPVVSRGTRPPLPAGRLPTISVIIPSLGQQDELASTLSSLTCQEYPCLETLVMTQADKAEMQASLDATHANWESARGLTQEGALNRGFSRSSGEIVSWIRPGDQLTRGALAAVARAFLAEPDLDLLYGNGVFLDEQGRRVINEQGVCRSAFWLEDLLSAKGTPVPFGYRVPSGTVFIRRRLFEQAGPFREELRLIADVELISRCGSLGKVRKLERTQAICRFPDRGGPKQLNTRLVEGYRFVRATWPRWYQAGYLSQLHRYVKSFLVRKGPSGNSKVIRRVCASIVSLAAASGLVNPERWRGRSPAFPPSRTLPVRLAASQVSSGSTGQPAPLARSA
jgi:glycosyltransferase involved in cell wall biosynthesis